MRAATTWRLPMIVAALAIGCGREAPRARAGEGKQYGRSVEVGQGRSASAAG